MKRRASALKSVGEPKIKRKAGTVRSILKRPPAGLPLLGSFRVKWSNPTKKIPATLHFYEDWLEHTSIAADNIDLEITPASRAIFSKYLHTVSWVYNTQTTEEQLCLDVYPKNLPMPNAGTLVENLFGITHTLEEDAEENRAWDGLIQELVVAHNSRNYSGSSSQHPDLRATLRGYQASAVEWMMERENSEKELNMDWISEVADILNLPNQKTLLFNKYTSTLFEPFETTVIRSGGILADEMGLGKTVITLALILNHQQSSVPSWEICKEVVDEEEEFESDEDRPLRREKNLEGSLNATEKLQLVPSKPGRGILMRQMTSWYESQLAEMAPKRKANRQRRRTRFKCICGDEIGRRRKDVVQCCSCRLKQHAKCVGFKRNLDYICPACWKLQQPVPSRATLIITPPAIFQQWAHEIENHAPALKTFLYTGVRDKFVQPQHLADFDVVVTTFPILRGETTYGTETTERQLRNESRFLRQTCPLECLHWWRVVCDEAQMFESDASLIRVMVNRLQAVHRWCVTGTPIQKGVADLFYLTSFMGMGPLDEKKIWTEFLLKPYLANCKTPLLSVLGQVFWRSTKDLVCDELAIPEQTFTRHLLNFSATETFFYSQIHETCSKKFSERLFKSKIDDGRSLASLDKSEMKRLLEPLLNLRQACTHAQIVTGINILREGKVSTLSELLDYLCKKTKIECDDAIREHVGALNGIAGLYWLEENFQSAVENYRAILRLSEEGTKKSDIHVDTLQLIHTMTNLKILLEEHAGVIAPTLRDSTLGEQVAELEKKYLAKPKSGLEGSVKDAKALGCEVNSLFESFEMSPMTWWMPILMSTADYESELLFKLNEQLNSTDFREKEAAKKFLNSIKSVRNIEVIVREWWTEVEQCHEAATEGIESLLEIDCDQLVKDALECHLRNTKRAKCQLCRVENELLDLECQLFATSRKEFGQVAKVLDGADTRGSWKPNRAECLLTVVVNFARSRTQVDPVMLRDRSTHVKLIEALKKEFKQLRAVWTALNHCVHAQDELAMAKWRLRFAEPWERVKKNARHKELAMALSLPEQAQKIHVIYPGQVPDMMAVLKANDAFKVFEQKRGKLFYLRNLGKNENIEPDPCPICRNELKTVWTVLTCGHCYCVKCFESIRGSLVSCPVCRQVTGAVEVSFVEDGALKKPESESADDCQIVANYSAKVDSVVAEVLRLTREAHDIKILIFSTWGEVLKILSEALTKNKITSLSLPSHKHQKILEDFKNMQSGLTVLLLPLAWGSKGLNLVEATHVFLVEPILNPAEELQAIGRVHRIGQTRPTVVHRFIMKQTIEEKIFEVVSEAKDTWTKKQATLADLQNLFSKSDCPDA